MPAPRTRTRRPETVPPSATTRSETRCPTASERGVTRSAVHPTVGGVNAPLTVVVATAVLFDGAGSGWLPSTVATFVIVPGDCGWTTMVIVALAPPASEPSEQTIVGRARAGALARAHGDERDAGRKRIADRDAGRRQRAPVRRDDRVDERAAHRRRIRRVRLRDREIDRRRAGSRRRRRRRRRRGRRRRRRRGRSRGRVGRRRSRRSRRSPSSFPARCSRSRRSPGRREPQFLPGYCFVTPPSSYVNGGMMSSPWPSWPETSPSAAGCSITYGFVLLPVA